MQYLAMEPNGHLHGWVATDDAKLLRDRDDPVDLSDKDRVIGSLRTLKYIYRVTQPSSSGFTLWTFKTKPALYLSMVLFGTAALPVEHDTHFLTLYTPVKIGNRTLASNPKSDCQYESWNEDLPSNPLGPDSSYPCSLDLDESDCKSFGLTCSTASGKSGLFKFTADVEVVRYGSR
jgi:hypothetical protein